MDDLNNGNRLEVGPARTAFLAGIVLCVFFAMPILTDSPKNSASLIDNKLNPNTASVCELAELPNIGPAKAKAIAEYRQNIRRRQGYGGQEVKAFESAKDLENIKGIGEKTAGKLKEWMKFDDTD